jgi:hypothetical protein
MSTARAEVARASFLDILFAIMNDPSRPLDFAVILDLVDSPGIEALRSGAQSARNLFAASAAHLDGERWVAASCAGEGFECIQEGEAGRSAALARFLDAPLDPHQDLPVRQLVIAPCDRGAAVVATRFHHSVADGLSAWLWLDHQLRVAVGHEPGITGRSPLERPSLRVHRAPVRKSRFAHRGVCGALWHRKGRPAHARRTRSVEVCAGALRSRCFAAGVTYNSLLATCLLEVFRRWNREHGAPADRLGLWVPVNIRRRRSLGFGNGTSRIRIYARWKEDDGFLVKCRAAHRQIAWSIRHGEWMIPDRRPLECVPLGVAAPALRAYLRRPWVDMASTVFSHAEGWVREHDAAWRSLRRIECIGQLHSRYPVVVNGATFQDRTWLTFTYDPALLDDADVEGLTAMFRDQVSRAERELP